MFEIAASRLLLHLDSRVALLTLLLCRCCHQQVTKTMRAAASAQSLSTAAASRW